MLRIKVGESNYSTPGAVNNEGIAETAEKPEKRISSAISALYTALGV